VDTGQEIVRASRWASDGALCWFPDSDAVLLTSFQNEALYKPTRADVRGSVGYGIGYAKGEEMARELFSLNLASHDIRRFADGDSVALSVASRQFIVRDQNTVRRLDLQGKELTRVRIARLGYSPVVPSPDGSLLLSNVRRNVPFYAEGRLTVVDLNHPGLRHILADDLVYRYKWVGTPEQAPTNTLSLN